LFYRPTRPTLSGVTVARAVPATASPIRAFSASWSRRGWWWWWWKPPAGDRRRHNGPRGIAHACFSEPACCRRGAGRDPNASL